MQSADTHPEKLEILDDRACADRLAALRWPGGFSCGECGATAHYRLARRPRVFECARCHRQQSVTAGTALHRSRVPLASWFVAASLMVRPEGVSAAELERRLGVTYETAWQLLHKLRGALSDEPRGLITGIANAAGLPIPTRPPRGVKGYGPTTAIGCAPVLVIAGAEGTVIAAPRSLRPPHGAREVRTRATGPIVTNGNMVYWLASLEAQRGDILPCLRVYRRVAEVLLVTHRSVSREWLDRYLRENSYRINAPAGRGPDDVLTCAMNAAWHPIAARTVSPQAA